MSGQAYGGGGPYSPSHQRYQQQQQQPAWRPQQQEQRGARPASPLSPPSPLSAAAGPALLARPPPLAARAAFADAGAMLGAPFSQSPPRGQQQQQQQQQQQHDDPYQPRASPPSSPPPPLLLAAAPSPRPLMLLPPPPPKSLGRSLADLAQHRVRGRVPARFELGLVPFFASDLPPGLGPRARLCWERGQKAYATDAAPVNPNTRAVFWQPQQRLAQRATVYWDPGAGRFAPKEYAIKLQVVRGRGGGGGGGDRSSSSSSRSSGGDGAGASTVARLSLDLAAYCCRDPSAASLPPIEAFFEMQPFGRVKMSVKATWLHWEEEEEERDEGEDGARSAASGVVAAGGPGVGRPGVGGWGAGGAIDEEEEEAAEQQQQQQQQAPPVVRPLHPNGVGDHDDPFAQEEARLAALRALQADCDARRAAAEGRLRRGGRFAAAAAAGGGDGGGGPWWGARLLRLLCPCCVPRAEEEAAAAAAARAREAFARMAEKQQREQQWSWDGQAQRGRRREGEGEEGEGAAEAAGDGGPSRDRAWAYAPPEGGSIASSLFASLPSRSRSPSPPRGPVAAGPGWASPGGRPVALGGGGRCGKSSN
jgi:hypothetical protein